MSCYITHTRCIHRLLVAHLLLAFNLQLLLLVTTVTRYFRLVTCVTLGGFNY